VKELFNVYTGKHSAQMPSTDDRHAKINSHRFVMLFSPTSAIIYSFKSVRKLATDRRRQAKLSA